MKQKKRSGKPFRASDAMYVDDAFTQCKNDAQNFVNSIAFIRQLRNFYKFYYLYHLSRAISPRATIRFRYDRIVIKCAEKHNAGPHFVSCLFDTLNEQLQNRPKPKKSYSHAAPKTRAQRDLLQRITKDATYTARKHFAKLISKLNSTNKGYAKELIEVEEGTVFFNRMIKFYFTKQIPKMLSAELYLRTVAINPNVEKYYRLAMVDENPVYERVHSERYYGAFYCFGEEVAALMFTELYS